MGRIVKVSPATATTTATNSAEAVAALVRARADAKLAAIVWARKMAEKIVGHAVDVDAQIMRDIVAQACSAAQPGLEAVSLRVHPDDLASLAEARAALAEKADV